MIRRGGNPKKDLRNSLTMTRDLTNLRGQDPIWQACSENADPTVVVATTHRAPPPLTRRLPSRVGHPTRPEPPASNTERRRFDLDSESESSPVAGSAVTWMRWRGEESPSCIEFSSWRREMRAGEGDGKWPLKFTDSPSVIRSSLERENMLRSS
ncbi:hypothetical protein DY000_02055293 [Brassica cretica]|uniref:Uncharacterized protein n=1 Tax=Brassica cretica TaxID=69181 RepID=A0ABQ7A7E4_BRACR|nr:hypothetical protein DY000_02055293 [Brassica cretica]